MEEVIVLNGKDKKHRGTGLYEEAEGILGIPHRTLETLKQISERFEFTRRLVNLFELFRPSEQLTWGHHSEVASLKQIEVVKDKIFLWILSTRCLLFVYRVSTGAYNCLQEKREKAVYIALARLSIFQ